MSDIDGCSKCPHINAEARTAQEGVRNRVVTLEKALDRLIRVTDNMAETCNSNLADEELAATRRILGKHYGT